MAVTKEEIVETLKGMTAIELSELPRCRCRCCWRRR